VVSDRERWYPGPRQEIGIRERVKERGLVFSLVTSLEKNNKLNICSFSVINQKVEHLDFLILFFE